MKKTLLALMLVSSLFVISCGADSTKPGDLQAKSYESQTGTARHVAQAQASGVETTKQINASDIYMDLNITGDNNSVKITKILSVRTRDAEGNYTSDVTFTETKNAAKDIVLSVTVPIIKTSTPDVEIAYQYRVDTVPISSQNKVDVSRIKPTLEAEVVYNSTSHSSGITITDDVLTGKKVIYKLYLYDTEYELPTPESVTANSINLDPTSLSPQQGNKIYYKIWAY